MFNLPRACVFHAIQGAPQYLAAVNRRGVRIARIKRAMRKYGMRSILWTAGNGNWHGIAVLCDGVLTG